MAVAVAVVAVGVAVVVAVPLPGARCCLSFQIVASESALLLVPANEDFCARIHPY